MLIELRIENLLLLERAELALGDGLNVITGETGAGKTMLAHALDLLLGGKQRRGIVRPGAKETYVEGVFEARADLFADADFRDLRERVDLDAELVLARRVTAEGRSRAYLQGRSVSASDLGRIGSTLLGFYGQHEHRKLTLASAQLDVLDAFCGEAQLADRASCRHEWARASALRRELDELAQRAGTRERDLDLLEFELHEIEEAQPDEAEEAQLEAESRRLGSAEGLQASAAAALEALDSTSETGAADRIALAVAELERASGIDPELSQLAERGGSLVEEARELSRELGDYGSSLNPDPGRLAEVDERLDLLARLKRKHGGTIAAVIEHANRCRSERERLASTADQSERLERELDGVEGELERIAAALGERRRTGAAGLSQSVREQFAGLAMPDASFEARIDSLEEIGPKGSEAVRFEIATNPGVPAGPLREIASGGELSRVMLALMTTATGAAGSPTVVFDEVDAGIGGTTARSIGEKLRALSSERQVICITHLPQVASQASRHFRVTKGVAQQADGAPAPAVARTEVERLGSAGVVSELCRMLGADAEDGVARQHAERMLEAA